ncbi:universal stress protein UspC [Kosakonia cowanii]|uniref:universal stress protein UspC n=1 Tax=Kosakonia TaxID=1330547 RepID=UPI000B96BC54|nr:MULTISPECIES: universal stress protein UspC [Kosakonia]MDT3412622.1 universal stress protein C [Atlantibacter sp. SORGH_AS_0304]AST69802.1 universal stress protein UspC [Kosakonia cowanii]MBK0016563.1 universal stress protein UspC [Kosakonia sp. S42]MBK0078599.1 universal stress protein UspC [Kosakonia sp. S57]MBK0085308.1 universal stress protein UspC [Kosakonia sp. S58]
MAYAHLLVAVAMTPESRQLLAKAIDIARPSHARITLITFAADPELYNQLAAPMMESVRTLLQEELQQFLNELVTSAHYPIEQTLIATGELSEHISHVCRTRGVDLVICGNHNQTFFARAACSAKSIVKTSEVDVLLVSLEG